jgi:hypothetical protein
MAFRSRGFADLTRKRGTRAIHQAARVVKIGDLATTAMAQLVSGNEATHTLDNIDNNVVFVRREQDGSENFHP